MISRKTVSAIKGLPQATKELLTKEQRDAIDIVSMCSTKKGYNTERGAIDSADHPEITRAYRCRFCDKWHRTSTPLR